MSTDVLRRKGKPVSPISKRHPLLVVGVERQVFLLMSVGVELPGNTGFWLAGSEARKTTWSFLTEKRRENRPDPGRNGVAGDLAGLFFEDDFGRVWGRRTPQIQAEMRVLVVWTDSPSGWTESEFENG